MNEAKAIEIDGRTGEGGGQLVRIACALAAVASQPIRITNVRGNREGPRGGGLKSQHVSSIAWLVKATDAEVTGLAVGSHTLEFRPRLKPWDLESRNIKIAADSSAASTLLIFQAIFPFLLFASNDRGDPIQLSISGGTNVSWSLSYEYMDQVLLPSLERTFGIKVDRSLKSRGWSLGKITRGTILFTIYPQKPDEPLRLLRSESDWTEEDLDVVAIDASIVAPYSMHESLTECLVQDLGDFFPGADVEFKVTEDSGDDSRIYVLLVAKSKTGPIWGRDILTSVPKKSRGKGGNTGATASVSESVARKVSKELFAEVSSGGVIDEFLQDQLIIFQALAEGRSSFPRSGIFTSSDAASVLSPPKKEPSKKGGASTMSPKEKSLAAAMLSPRKKETKSGVSTPMRSSTPTLSPKKGITATVTPLQESPASSPAKAHSASTDQTTTTTTTTENPSPARSPGTPTENGSTNGNGTSHHINGNGHQNGHSAPGTADLENALNDLTIGDRERRDKTHEPFGEGSTHTKTARWVASQLLPQVNWFNKGRICEGVGMVSVRKFPEQQLSSS
ncbi:RNA 3'-terminal phosphate cyclase-domain-containing protein [Cercophora newfieldiana]|uniref:RNA 3'-terminal phosphate cyclase-domain-containing protein n=1 Tax=Cercophora newfieldiana TaxID=92897 RepID=A0AA39YRT6_9PEZI|nr:RNA 3'-terminal phosphate cyclase-domain-containing protein [Cercophora newfieldiana]